MVSITFDDGWIGQATFASPMLAERGWPGTFYLVPDWLGGEKSGEKFLTIEQAKQLIVAGHEIGNHTEHHQTLTRLKPRRMYKEMDLAQVHLSEWLSISRDSILSLASPHGTFDKRVLTNAKKLFESHRSGKTVLNTPDTDPFVLGAFLIENDNKRIRSPEWLGNLLQRAADERSWAVLVFHNIVDGPVRRGTSETLRDFERTLDQIQESGLEVVTVSEGVEAIHAANTRAD